MTQHVLGGGGCNIWHTYGCLHYLCPMHKRELTCKVIANTSVKPVLVDLFEARAPGPRLPVRSDLRRDRFLSLLLERLVPILVVRCSSKERHTHQPRGQVEVIFAGGLTPEETGFGKLGREADEDKVRDRLPVGDGVLEEALFGLLGHRTFVDGEDAAVGRLLGLVERTKFRPLGEIGVLIEGVLA